MPSSPRVWIEYDILKSITRFNSLLHRFYAKSWSKFFFCKKCMTFWEIVVFYRYIFRNLDKFNNRTTFCLRTRYGEDIHILSSVRIKKNSVNLLHDLLSFMTAKCIHVSSVKHLLILLKSLLSEKITIYMFIVF